MNLKPSVFSVVLILATLFSVSDIYSQPVTGRYVYSTSSQKAIKSYEKAMELYRLRDYGESLKYLSKALKTDDRFLEVYLLLGDISAEQGDLNEAVKNYRIALSIDSLFSPSVFYILGLHELSMGMYSDAIKHFRSFISIEEVHPERKKNAVEKLSYAQSALELFNNPVPFNPVNLGDSVNSADDEYINAITADKALLYFTVRRPRDQFTVGGNDFEEDFYYCRSIADTIWYKRQFMPPPVNSHGNEGALCISPDGMYLFFSACHRPDGKGSCDIYYSRRNGDLWRVPVNLGSPVNTDRWESQPSLSSDGRTLYYSSSRKGGNGKADIWKSILNEDGTWSEPENLGTKINTSGSEMSPFIHPDGRTLYFSSDGHKGLGGIDLYVARLDENGTWGEPENLGYPINTFSDEINIIVDAAGQYAFLSSEKYGGSGKYDIYYFELHEKARPLAVTYLKGKVYDEKSSNPLHASFKLIDLSSGEEIVNSDSDPVTGEFLVCIPADNDYALNVSCKGYLFYSDHFQLSGTHTISKPFLKDIAMRPVEQGMTVILRNIFFETDKSTLRDKSLPELGKVLDFLKNNPSIHIEISGHTDNTGSQAYNQKLSDDRALAVYNFLIEKGISPERLSYQGYGFSRPVDSNDTEEGRANNRRTEFKVIGL